MDTTSLTITGALEAFAKREIAPQNLTEACFAQIKRLNPTLNAYITVIEPKKTLEAQRPPINTAPLNHALRGIPIAVKDLFDVEGIRTTAGSKFFADHIAENDAFVVERLKQAGALINGKTNTHEIALGVTGENPHYGTARNPWDTERIAGGSSSGSAIAVATGMALGALGTDTGGSIRIPASLCGVVGFKPTRGRVSTRGVFPLSWNLDHVGPLTKCVKDAAVMLQVISVYDAVDPSSIKMLTGDYLGHLIDDMSGRKIAIASGEFIESADTEVLEALHDAAKIFESMGCKIQKINVDWLNDAALANSTMIQTDAAAVHRDRLKEHPEMFGDDIRLRLEEGTNRSATEYVLARRTQADARKRFELFFESYDFLILPTTPIAAPPVTGLDSIEQAGRLNLFTKPFNLTGLPALSVPCGFTSEGLPIGLQIVAKAWGDAKALNAGYAYEQATEWHKKFPMI
ncbi:MAG TPA: Asp-tRNA(Asn)/Glu-tRNA(Gln) amidotransferase subunit GatA [Anaerolineae bacterium]|nr:Asp-tRNA(Asn)/Glu-tRNA(Gln) amidotransferase subunit GatA [Anaerolineae bacterium]